jgi:putative toxin-antitoxin system antitoxin component (TIGR02293 family)
MGVVVKKAAAKKERVSTIIKPVKQKTGTRNLIADVTKWNTSQMIEVIEHGVTKSEVEEVKSQTGLDYETLAHILTVTKATLHNKKGNDTFNAVVSERLLLLADLYAYGIEVFGEKERFNRWLVSEIRALAFKRPIDKLNTTLGIQEVKQIIGRIDYGVYS